MAIEVQKGVPLPPKRRGKNIRYPWSTLEVGDSFVFPWRTNERDTMNQAGSIIAWRHRSTCFRYEKRLCEEKQPDGSMMTVMRIWRVK